MGFKWHCLLRSMIKKLKNTAGGKRITDLCFLLFLITIVVLCFVNISEAFVMLSKSF